MAYDIFGQPLRPGYCEVHPDVPEPYPCYVCLEEHAHYQQEQEIRYREPEYSFEDEMEYLRRQKKTDQKLIEEQAAQLKAAEARVKELEQGFREVLVCARNISEGYYEDAALLGRIARSFVGVKND